MSQAGKYVSTLIQTVIAFIPYTFMFFKTHRETQSIRLHTHTAATTQPHTCQSKDQSKRKLGRKLAIQPVGAMAMLTKVKRQVILAITMQDKAYQDLQWQQSRRRSPQVSIIPIAFSMIIAKRWER